MRGTGTDCTGLVTRSSKRLRCRILLAKPLLRYPASHCSIDSQAGSGTLPGSTDHLSTSSHVVTGSHLRSVDHPLCPTPKRFGLCFGLSLWLRTPASSLFSPLSLRLL